MKRLTIFLVFFISISVFSVLSCSNNDEEIFRIVNALIGPEGGSITSSDGKLTLDIPPDALDEDTEITIRKINPNDLPPEFDGLDTNLVYLLEPDGLQFNIPIEVELLTDQEVLDQDGNIAVDSSVLLTSLDGELEVLSNLETMVNVDENTVLEKGSVEHFSSLVEVRGGITIKIENVPNIIGINIPFKVNVSLISSISSLDELNDAFYTDKSDADIFSLSLTPLVFEAILFSGEDSDIFGDTVFKTSFDYICRNMQPTSGIFRAQIDVFTTILTLRGEIPVTFKKTLSNAV